MLISCKCLNFIATSTQRQQQKSGGVSSASAVATSTADASTLLPAAHAPNALCNDVGIGNNNSLASGLPETLMQVFLEKYPRPFYFYSQCMDFFKQAFGPIPNLSINAVNQPELIYSFTLDSACTSNVGNASMESWQFIFCINCNTALCAKRLQVTNGSSIDFLVNSALLTTNDELAQRRGDKSFSETFGILIMDHPQLDQEQQQQLLQQQQQLQPQQSGINVMASSLNLATALGPVDLKQQRLRQLQVQQQARLKREIAETDERIQRYTEQQFALLKSFREKSDQEYALLSRLIQRVPDQTNELLDRTLPALEVNGGTVSGYASSRRRNTISSRRDLNSTGNATVPTTPTTVQPPNFLALPITTTTLNSKNNNNNNNNLSNISAIAVNAAATTTTFASAAATQAQRGTITSTAAPVGGGPTTTIVSSGLGRKLSNFDTPPATPEATPMSIGNSPTFRQQQQQQPQQQQPPTFNRFALAMAQTATFQQQFPTPSAESADDCLFDLEDVDVQMPMQNYQQSHLRTLLQQQTAPPYQRLLSLQQQQQQQQESNMSDLDESDAAEEAEDALDLDSSLPIPMHKKSHRATPAQFLNFAKSLPIEIANSPLTEARTFVGQDVEDEMDNTVDIAASIKALAKSVHGEAVFGDLPRPRLRSQI